MQQFNAALAGKEDPIEKFDSRVLASCQKCFRTNDIEEVGDDSHHTFFEMLGNWSIGQEPELLRRVETVAETSFFSRLAFGSTNEVHRQESVGYFKEGAVKYALEFFCDVLGLKKNQLWASVFKGEEGIPKDEEAIRIWQKNGIPKERIREFGMEDNFWGPVGETGPCGPCSEIYFDRGKKFGCGKRDCGPNCPNCQRFIELWNLVFMEYEKKTQNAKRKVQSYEYVKLPQKNVDTGIGFERLVAVLENKNSAYETDLFLPLIQEIENLSGRNYEEEKKSFRIISDHIRGAVFLIADGVLPSNLDRGYILRRVIRSSIRYAKVLDLKNYWYVNLIKKITKIYGKVYPELKKKETDIITVIQNEEEKFRKTLEKGLVQFDKLLKSKTESRRGGTKVKKRTSSSSPFKSQKSKVLNGAEIFDLYQSYGFPLELTEELAREKGFQIDKDGFQEEFRRHQEISRAGAEKKFGLKKP
jgi:alanyl-tRNA synthetase